jgi:rhodanese-related sulfurtransferase
MVLIAPVLFMSISTTVNATSPEQISGVTRVSAEEFISIVTDIPELVIIDSRITANRKHGYIEDSVSLPDTKTDCNSLASHIHAKEAPVAFYCNGVKCGRSVTASKIAVSCGYKNIYWFRGGFEEWKSKDYPYLKHE